MEEDFDDIIRLGVDSYGLLCRYSEGEYVYYSNYHQLLIAYKDLKERHQKLLDLAGGHYL